MQPISQFEAAHMTPRQLVHECWEQDYTYQDYTTNCELLKVEALSKETFNRFYEEFDTVMAASIAKRQACPSAERHYFRNL